MSAILYADNAFDYNKKTIWPTFFSFEAYTMKSFFAFGRMKLKFIRGGVSVVNPFH